MEKKTIMLDGLEVTQDEKGITLTGEVIEIYLILNLK